MGWWGWSKGGCRRMQEPASPSARRSTSPLPSSFELVSDPETARLRRPDAQPTARQSVGTILFEFICSFFSEAALQGDFHSDKPKRCVYINVACCVYIYDVRCVYIHISFARLGFLC